jgi:hypothetical protein
MNSNTQTTESTSATAREQYSVTVNRKIWQELLKIAGRQIDPENAEVCWWFGQVVDPYGVRPDLPPECDCVGRLYFARNPENSVWVEFGDLPDATRKALWNKPDNSSSDVDADVPF